MKKSILLFIIFNSFAFIASQAQITNGNFESGGYSFCSEEIPGWYASHGDDAVVDDAGISGHSNAAFMKSTLYQDPLKEESGIYTNYTFKSGCTYTISFWYQGTASNNYNQFNLHSKLAMGLNSHTSCAVSSSIPSPTTSQSCTTITSQSSGGTTVSFNITANANYSQLWFYFHYNNPGTTYYDAGGMSGFIDDVVVTPTVTAPNVTHGYTCPGFGATLSASGAPVGGSYKWYDGSGTIISGQTGSSYTTGAISSTTTYYVSAVSSGGCESYKTAVYAYPTNTPPAAPSVTPGNTCVGGNATLSASSSVTNPVFRWFNVSSGGTSVGTGSTYLTPSITSLTYYWVSVKDQYNCESSRTQVEAYTSNPGRAASVASVAVCDGQTATFNSYPGDYDPTIYTYTYAWYTSASGGSAISTNSSYTTPTLSENTPFNDYYVEITRNDNCVGPRTKATAFVFNKNKSADFDVSLQGERITVPSNESYYDRGTGNFTIEAWVKLASGTNPIVSKRASGNSAGFVFYSLGTTLRIIINGNTYNSSSFTSINDGNWHHVAVRRAGSTITFILDGTDRGTASSSADMSSAANLVFGKDEYDATNLDGNVDEVRFWNVARNSTQISNNKGLNIAGNAIGLIGYWSFNEGSTEQTMLDFSNNRNNAVRGTSTSSESGYDPDLTSSAVPYTGCTIGGDARLADKGFNENEGVNIAPNPFSNGTILTSTEAYKISILNINGIEVYFGKIEAHESVDLGQDLSAGLYIIKLTGNTDVKTVKMIKY